VRSRLKAQARRAAARAASALLPAGGAEGLRILTYHRVNDRHPADRLTVHPTAFREQMEAILSRGRPVLSLAEALPFVHGREPQPPGALVITFDDGYEDNFRVALPILEGLGLKATIFVATGLLGTPETIERYRGCCADDRMLDWAQVREMRERGSEIGGHGRHHRELALLPAADAEAEVEGCALDIAAHTGERPRLFCYPRGSESPAVQEIVSARGFEAACTVYPGSNPPGTPPLALRRTEISGDDGLADFDLKLRGGYDAWHRLAQLTRRRRGARVGDS
jgi:peptidoglycan/xylan/chitin deacetylase (PgdA/CDA1 family)